ncbi:MAG TPA: lipoyl synthase [Acidimicrobiia bacterium]
MNMNARWLGRVPYGEAFVLQRALHERSGDDYLLLLEHPHVYTMGSKAKPQHVLLDDVASVGAELVDADRGGDVTYHGPGQLVGYPIVTLPDGRDVVAYVRRLEGLLIDVLADFGIAGRRDTGYTGVWVGTPAGESKIAAIGVRVARGRTRHGFALNVAPDLAMFDHIVPCGISDRGVTSMAELLGDATPSMAEVVARVVARAGDALGMCGPTVRADVIDASGSDARDVANIAGLSGNGDTSAPVRLLGRLAQAGVETTAVDSPSARRARPEWMRVKARMGPEFTDLKRRMRGLDLHTVCEEAGCPNIYECWSAGTATFMILGDRCTRACGFCLIDTRKPLPVDADEPRRVADAVEAMDLEHVVITCVARDDLADGGAAAFAATVDAVRLRCPRTRVELLISDCGGDANALATIFASHPDVLNHNLETVARLQRAARPSAGYARSLAVLARARDAGLVTKSGLILGMGETDDEVRVAMTDLHNVGVEILTIGQYLQPSARHLPVVRWYTPAEFDALRVFGGTLGFAHVESGPLVRSSYHAREGVERTSLLTS